MLTALCVIVQTVVAPPSEIVYNDGNVIFTLSPLNKKLVSELIVIVIVPFKPVVVNAGTNVLVVAPNVPYVIAGIEAALV